MPIETILPGIKAANQIYFNQVDEILKLNEINIRLNLESAELRTSLAVCHKDWKTSDEIKQTLRLQMNEQTGIIDNQGKIIKIMAGIAAASIGYATYKLIK